MTIIQIFYIFMITTSITLTGFVIRQRKNNRMLGELVAQNKVNGYNRYSKLNVGMRNQEYVSKCPSCAEWTNLEAKVCKSCQSSVAEHNSAIKESMARLDQELNELQIAKAQHNKEQMRSLFKNKIFRISVIAALIIILFLAISNILSRAKYNKLTAMPTSASALVNSWESVVNECRFLGITPKTKPEIGSTGGVELSIDIPSNLESFDWDSVLGKEIICFSEKALGLDVSKKLDSNSVNNVNLQNRYSIFGSYDRSYIAFYWG
jgi:hypothetical protein